MTTLAGGIAAYSGWNVGTARFNEVKELEIYSSKKEMFRQRHSWQTMAALAYATPTVIRTFVMMTFLTGIPPLVGVYYNDTDYVASYAVSGTVGGILVSSLLSSRDFGGIRQKLVAGLLALPPALGLGCLAVMSQKYDTYVHYDMYKKRWRNIDPLWSEFVEKVEQEKALKEAEGIVESESLQKNSEV